MTPVNVLGQQGGEGAEFVMKYKTKEEVFSSIELKTSMSVAIVVAAGEEALRFNTKPVILPLTMLLACQICH